MDVETVLFNANNTPQINADGTLKLTTAGVAYQEVAGWLACARLLKLGVQPGGIWVATLAGGRGYAVWHPARSMSYALPAAWAVSVKQDLAGVTTPLNGASNVTIGSEPILLR